MLLVQLRITTAMTCLMASVAFQTEAAAWYVKSCWTGKQRHANDLPAKQVKRYERADMALHACSLICISAAV